MSAMAFFFKNDTKYAIVGVTTNNIYVNNQPVSSHFAAQSMPKSMTIIFFQRVIFWFSGEVGIE